MARKKLPCTCAWCRRDLGNVVELIDHVLATHYKCAQPTAETRAQ